jgi:predicted RNA polymerase sigma factor
VRGDLQEKLGRLDEARAEFERGRAADRELAAAAALLERAAACAAQR